MEVNFPRIRRFMLESAAPISNVLGKIHIPTTRLLTKEQIREVESKLSPGDVLLSRQRLTATNFFIPGFWKHAAIYVGDGMIVEAVTPHVRAVSFAKFAATKDYIQVMDPTFADREEMPLAANFAVTLVGTPYDLIFEYTHTRARNKAFYCSEVIWWCYDQVLTAAGKPSPFTPRLTLGSPTVLPQDYADAKDKWAVKWASNA